MPKHYTKPVIVEEDYCRIAQPALSNKTGVPLVRSYRYLNNWIQTGQLFSFSNGIDSTYGDDVGSTENGLFHIILPTSYKAESTNRLLEGRLIPWFYEPTSGVQDVEVLWQQSGGTSQTLYNSENKKVEGTPVDRRGWLLKTKWTSSGTEEFGYDPSSGGGNWTYGILTTKGIHTAALGVWSAPDNWLSNKQAVVLYERMAKGEIIRGYTTEDGRESVGELMSRVGANLDTEDGLLQNATRCVWQWGFPTGVYTTSNSYQQVGASGVEYKLYVPDLWSSSTIEVYPTAILQVDGSSGGDPAYFRLTAEDLGGGADTWTLTLTSDGKSLYDYTDASNDKLLVRAGSTTSFKIELMAPSSGHIIMWTLAIWAKLWES